MRMGIAAALMAVTIPAHAGEAPATFEFKGVKATDQRAPHEALFSKCEVYFGFTGCTFKDGSFAGVDGTLEIGWGDEGRTLLLVRGYFDGKSYPALRDEFRRKWGEPARFTEIEEKGAFDLVRQKQESVWLFAEGELTLTGPGAANASRFEFVTPERKAFLEAMEKD